MKENTRPDSNPENPEELLNLRQSAPSDAAAGMTAIFSGAKHLLEEMNVGRGIKALRKLNQKDGFDCPGCAWPDPDGDRSQLGEFCENGVKAIAEEATTKKLNAEFFRQHSVTELAELNDYEIGKKGRVAEPVYLAPGATHYTPISWDDAFAKIAGHLNGLASPDEAIFYTSGRTSNEAAFLYQLFVREFGTNNLPDCSNMCHESSGVALLETLGTGKGSVTLDDFNKAEVILILGQNPGTNHPRMLTALQKAKKNGAKIISINPLPETGLISFRNPQTVAGALGIKAALTDLFLPVKINGDMALLRGIEKILLEEELQQPGSVFDREFIQQHTTGYEDLVRDLKDQSLDHLSKVSGITQSQIREAADMLKNKSRIIACWAMGLTQHKNAVATIQEIVNLLLLKGSIGKEGAGVCPVRGHSNVQGDRTMGINERPPATFLDRLDTAMGITSPRKDGLDVVDSIKAMHDGRAKLFIALGGNFLSATPDTLFTAEALRNCSLTVQVSTKLNRSHLVHGREALILPCLGRSDKDIQNGTEQFVSCENSMSVVQLSKGNLHPISGSLLSEPVIVCRLAKATLGGRSKIHWDKYLNHYDHIREDIEKAIPGFEQYNKRVREPGGFYLRNAAREREFRTLSQKAHFTVSPITEHVLKENEYLMMTIRSHDQFNTTIYGLNDRYRGIHQERRVIFMNEKDMAREGLESGTIVDLHNHFGGNHRQARKFIVVPYAIPEKCTATYFPEANVLVPIDSTADKSNTPTSKTVVITLSRH
ncbi:MAG: FdhF/YdeP family oxidoreductase [Cyclobacteriaceae bacterium]|nr:FdhF/YdeP family oxidoreductase [Cyclobacteriaceae bacterium]